MKCGKYSVKHVFIVMILLIYLVPVTYQFNILSSLDELKNRTKRQTVCTRRQFTCDNNECIAIARKCDGKADCSDSSDESTVCRKEECPDYSFRCNYGACVSGKAECNGRQDCVDNSDENNAKCKSQVTIATPPTSGEQCRANRDFTCNNGQCVRRFYKCNGEVNCADGSDEIPETCKEEKCLTNSFQCGYGACLSQKVRCNGIKDCADNSDEDAVMCGYTITTTDATVVTHTIQTSGEECQVPYPPAKGVFVFAGRKFGPAPGSFTKETLQFFCNPSYVLLPEQQYIPCIHGKWVYAFPKCVSTCPARVSNTVNFNCVFNRIPQNCTQRQIEGTVVTMECKPHHKHISYSSNPPEKTTICTDGSWSHPILPCDAVCGVRAKARPLIIDGMDTSIDIHPWHVGVYRRVDSKIEHICGGTLINPVTVLSAAHCFSNAANGTPKSKELYLIAAGKNYRDLNDVRDKTTEEQRNIEQILIHKEYRGYIQSFRHDIALIKLNTPFTLSNTIALICVDYDNMIFDEISDGNATVVGWGVTEKSGKRGDPLLKQLDIPILKREECETRVPADFKPFLQDDKICAGKFTGQSVCTGDSGGGLITRNIMGFHFIRGITSNGPFLPNFNCNYMQVATYTKISKYTDFIRKSKDWYYT